jgi:hypothetical protein
MNMDWDYNGHKVYVSMLDYVHEALMRFQHRAPRKPWHQPYPHVKPNYKAKAQYTEDMVSVSSHPRVPSYTIGRDRGDE